MLFDNAISAAKVYTRVNAGQTQGAIICTQGKNAWQLARNCYTHGNSRCFGVIAVFDSKYF
jgi:hypothetical protein